MKLARLEDVHGVCGGSCNDVADDDDCAIFVTSSAEVDDEDETTSNCVAT